MPNLHPSYDDYKEAVSKNARTIIQRPLDTGRSLSQEGSHCPTVLKLQDKLSSEFEGGSEGAAWRVSPAQVFGVALVVVATWVIGVALYANL